MQVKDIGMGVYSWKTQPITKMQNYRISNENI